MCDFEGNILNKMDDFIITQYTVSVAHFVNYGDVSESCIEEMTKCQSIVHTSTKKNQWIEPKESERFMFPINQHTLHDCCETRRDPERICGAAEL